MNVVGIIDCDLYNDSFIDLYIAVKNFYKESYHPNDRIIVKSTFDYYSKENNYGKIIQSLQVIINVVDISNFFIIWQTTNPNAHLEYKQILQEHSTDKVPFTVEIIEGKFTKLPGQQVKAFTKIENYTLNNDFANYTEDQKHLLFKSKTFCLAPWTSLFVNANNDVAPCCIYKDSVGSSNKDSLKEIWNNQKTKNLRRKMLAEEPVPACATCYKKESYGRDSARNSINRALGHHITKVSETQNDGYAKTFELAHLDAAFNNLCNLSCRSCGHYSSTSWHKPALELGIIASDTPVFLEAGRTPGDMVTQIAEHINSLERIYFAGGEPLIIEEYYQIVELLDKHQRHDVELIYNTNMTKSSLKQWSIFDLWKNFTNITVEASLDGEYQRGEYLRTGTHWNDVLDFVNQLKQNRPDINFYVSSTTSIINALHVPDFHKNWVEKDLIKPEQFNIQLLFNPQYMRIDTAPLKLKEKIVQKYTEHLKWLQPLDSLGRATSGFASIINQIDSDVKFDRKLFWDNVNLLDKYHNTNLLETFPELEDLQ